MPLGDFFNPTPSSPRTPEDHQTLRNSWSGFLKNPDTRAALIQFGISMLQPTGAGQDLFGQIGQSIGAAGETVADRQTQRTEMANADISRQIDIAGLGLRSEEMQRLREQGEEDTSIRREALGVNRFEANTGRINAETARSTAEAGGLTPNQLLDERSKAYTKWNELMGDEFVNPDSGERKRLSPLPPPWEKFWGDWQSAVGLGGNTTSSSAVANETGLPLTAAPAGPANAGAPAAVQEAKVTSQQIQLTDPDRFNRLKAALTHPDPTTRKMAEELVRTYITDAEAFLQTVRTPAQ